MVSFILPGNSASGEYEVANSCRFNDGSSDNLVRTNASATNNTKYTYSVWVKRATLGTNQSILYNWYDGSNHAYIFFATDDKLALYDQLGGTDNINMKTSAVFRDVSAWYNIVVKVDTTESTQADRVRVFINGVEDSIGTRSAQPGSSASLGMKTNSLSNYMAISSFVNNSSNYLDGYIAEAVYIDGQALDPTSFGEFDEDSPNIWKPIDVSGLTFGNNGFYLDFEDSSSLGNDAAGSNNFTVNNLTSIDQSTDTCTNNFATLNPLTIVAGASLTLSEGNLTFNGTSTDAGAKATFGVSSGKWYWEVKTKLSDDNSSGSDRILVATENVRQITSATDPNSQGIWGIQSRSGSGATLNSFTNGTFSNGNSGSTGFNNGTIIGVALDADNGKLYFHKDGTYTDLSGNTGDPANGTNPTFTGLPTDGTLLFPYFENRPNVTPSSQVNFGGTQSFSISSGNSDGNGYGNFEYSVPSGYYALNTKNLAEYG